jgi:dihydroflavonol-4-reductase
MSHHQQPPITTSSLILVTGANGYLASWSIKFLLDQGYRVRGTVRNLKEEKKYAFLKHVSDSPGAESRLEFAQVELEKDEGWDDALKDVEGVLHMAMRIPKPSAKHEGNPQKVYLDPALLGVKHMLEACRRAGTVRRIVFTSSITAVTENFKNWRKHEFTPDDWNTTATLKHNAYAYAKTQAEKKVIEWMKSDENTTHMEYVTMCPNAIMGPPVKGNTIASETDINSVLEPMNGQVPFFPPMEIGVSDVRDLALCHIAGLTIPEAAGKRFILSGELLTAKEVMLIIKEKHPQYKKRFPKFTANKHIINAYARVGLNKSLRDYLQSNMGVRPRFNTSNVKEVLGITIRPAKETVEDSATWFIENGKVKSL